MYELHGASEIKIESVTDALHALAQGTLVGKFTPTAPNDSQWLPMAPDSSRAPYDYKHTLLLASNNSH